MDKVRRRQAFHFKFGQFDVPDGATGTKSDCIRLCGYRDRLQMIAPRPNLADNRGLRVA